MAIEAGALQALSRLIHNQNKVVRKESCWSVSNITAGSTDQIQNVLDIGLIDSLVKVTLEDDPEVK